MSYKYQRLRERLRQAVANGELAGKLPGERSLAKRFHVNAKTLSKALTDLAAEGLLDRSIGRGTYVKGSAPATMAPARWLVLCDEGDDSVDCMIEHFRRVNPDVHVSTTRAAPEMRPSFLAGFGAVIDVATETPDSFLRDLVVRNLPVVAVNREPRTYSTHAVLADAALGAQLMARDLIIAGHRRLIAVEPPGSTMISHALRQTAARYAPEFPATVDVCSPEDMRGGAGVAAALDYGATAIVCDSARTAHRVKEGLERRGVDVPGQLSLTAVGCVCGGDDACPCSGYFVDCVPVAHAVVGLLRDHPPARPTTLWLTGSFIDRGTVATVRLPADRGMAERSFGFGDAVA